MVLVGGGLEPKNSVGPGQGRIRNLRPSTRKMTNHSLWISSVYGIISLVIPNLPDLPFESLRQVLGVLTIHFDPQMYYNVICSSMVKENRDHITPLQGDICIPRI